MKRGEYYKSQVWLDPHHYYDTAVPLIVKITRVTTGTLYYRPYYGRHDDGTEWLGSPLCCDKHLAHRYIGKQVTL